MTELRENTFYASITVVQNGTELEIDSRSSDAIAVAVRAQVPIYAADEVIEESAIEMEGDDVNEEEIVDEFKRFLEGSRPRTSSRPASPSPKSSPSRAGRRRVALVDVDGRADDELGEHRRRDPHRHPHTPVRRRVGRHRRVAVDGIAAGEVARQVERAERAAVKPSTFRYTANWPTGVNRPGRPAVETGEFWVIWPSRTMKSTCSALSTSTWRPAVLYFGCGIAGFASAFHVAASAIPVRGRWFDLWNA